MTPWVTLLVLLRLAVGAPWITGALLLAHASKAGVKVKPAPGKLKRNHGSTGSRAGASSPALELDGCVVVGMALAAERPSLVSPAIPAVPVVRCTQGGA